mmetsp:Transcript_33896/g.34377  ORF Transcript_33896/g.34377 Transcript_33896/m.34377 type:complete len:118 (-) Transcript_33896:753-1106(-)
METGRKVKRMIRTVVHHHFERIVRGCKISLDDDNIRKDEDVTNEHNASYILMRPIMILIMINNNKLTTAATTSTILSPSSSLSLSWPTTKKNDQSQIVVGVGVVLIKITTLDLSTLQ